MYSAKGSEKDKDRKWKETQDAQGYNPQNKTGGDQTKNTNHDEP